MIRTRLAHAFWRFSKWKLDTLPAPERPSVFIGAPHTSNWDFILMLALVWEMGIDVRWLGKKEIFKGPFGMLFKALGGIPVDRKNPGHLVEDLIAQVKQGEMFGLVIAPDGTRSGNTHWKSGFYRIAREANLPVCMAYIDRDTLTTGLGPSIDLTGDSKADMDKIREFYADKSGFYPDRKVTPRLRQEGLEAPED